MTASRTSFGSQRRGKAVALAAALVLLVATVGCSPTAHFAQLTSQTVKALWFSGSGDKVQQGTTEVDITLGVEKYPTDFNLDLDTDQSQGAEPAWAAAAWSAASAATLFSFRDPRTVNITVSVDGPIDGTSAGGLMAATLLALSSGFELKADTTMTGTINPDGSIGMVGGIPAKIRAAKAAGLKKVLVPKGSQVVFDPKAEQELNIYEEASREGVEVVEVSSLLEAVAHLTDREQEFEERATKHLPIAVPVKKSIKQVATKLAKRTDRLVSKARKAGVSDAAVAAAQTRLNEGSAALAANEPVSAYAQLWQNYREIAGQLSAREARVLAKKENAEAARDDLSKQISDLNKLNNGKQATIGGTTANNIQQAIGLPDVMTWGLDSKAALTVYQDRLNAVGDTPRAADLSLIAQGVGQARASIEVPQEQTAQVLMDSGSGSISESDTAAYLANYTELLKRTGDANLNYYEQSLAQLESKDQKSNYRGKNFGYAAADTLRTLIHDATQVKGGSMQDQRTRTSLAVSFYLGSSQLVVANEILRLKSADSVDHKVEIRNRAGLASAVRSSNEVNALLLATLAKSKTDSSYAHWGVDWGQWESSREGHTYSDLVRLDGLLRTWRASMQLLLLNATPLQEPTESP